MMNDFVLKNRFYFLDNYSCHLYINNKSSQFNVNDNFFFQTLTSFDVEFYRVTICLGSCFDNKSCKNIDTSPFQELFIFLMCILS